MEDKINKRVYWLVYGFVVLSLHFPAFLLNKVFFFFLFVFMIFNQKIYRLSTYSPFIIFFIFLYGFILSFFYDSNRALSQQFFLSVLVLFLIYPIVKYKVDFELIAKKAGMLMVLYTGVAYLMILVFPNPLTPVFTEIFVTYSLGSNGLRDFAEEGTISFHLGTAPFLFLPFSLYVISFVEKKKLSTFLAILVIFITVFISASRGSIFICLLALAIIVFYKSKLSTKLLLLSITIPLFISLFSFLLLNTNVLDSNEGSNSIKLGHFESFVDHISFLNFFTGEGLGAFYYSKGSHDMRAITEITPCDMLRYLGFILAPVLYFYIFFPVRNIKAYLKNGLYFTLFLIYVINSMTNPTMFNSYGLLLVLWYWSEILREPATMSEQKTIII